MLYSNLLRKILWLTIFLSLNATANGMTEIEAKEKIIGNWRQYQTKMYEKENGEKVLKNEFIHDEEYRNNLKYTFRKDNTYSVVNHYIGPSPLTREYKITSDNDNLTITFINDGYPIPIPLRFEGELLVLGDDESFSTTFDNYFERESSQEE